MIFKATRLEGAFLIELESREDDRGFFARTFCRHEFAQHGIAFDVAQCNLSSNLRRGTLRGMHYQAPPHEEVKVIWCVRGAIYDVLIDLRPGSPTFRQHVAELLSGENHRMLYAPKGLAHGFLTLADDTDVFYWMSEFHDPACARGVRWNDPAFAIPWPEPVRVISDKDRSLPAFAG